MWKKGGACEGVATSLCYQRETAGRKANVCVEEWECLIETGRVREIEREIDDKLYGSGEKYSKIVLVKACR